MVAVPAVRVVQVAVDEEVHVISVRDRGVPAPLAVLVLHVMPRARMARGTLRRIVVVHREDVLVDMIAMPVMQVAVVQVVDVVTVTYRLVSARLAVIVRMLVVGRVVLHAVLLIERRGNAIERRGNAPREQEEAACLGLGRSDLPAAVTHEDEGTLVI
ncbi:hypothetical protein BE20_05130 [Sorangium cellulosum]|uniref:Uncharacterized protein n=1 Tax=Sorangium cellulosum TaxID=56 RepID=A0A150RW06_SORCE|nr:hypothetical protein BE18_47305 [Sorangium cellulosum]KYF94916.1 hypothetical protein BE20_05130 [Sorangium cellulosum]